MPGRKDTDYKMKILFTDLDGTLLNDKSHVSDYTKEVLKKMTDAGHKLVLSSGRPLDSVRQVVEEDGLDFSGMYISANNGATIYDLDKQEIILEKRVPMDMVHKVWDLCLERGVHIQTYTADGIVTPVHDREIDVYTERIHLKINYADNPEEVLTVCPFKLLAIELYDKSVLEALKKDIIEQFGDKLTAIFSNDRYLEIFDATAGKGQSLKWLCNELGIDIKDSYAAGDEMNDQSMIEAAGNGIFMCNGNPALMDSADIVSEYSNDEDGLARVIEEYIL